MTGPPHQIWCRLPSIRGIICCFLQFFIIFTLNLSNGMCNEQYTEEQGTGSSQTLYNLQLENEALVTRLARLQEWRLERGEGGDA